MDRAICTLAGRFPPAALLVAADPNGRRLRPHFRRAAAPAARHPLLAAVAAVQRGAKPASHPRPHRPAPAPGLRAHLAAGYDRRGLSGLAGVGAALPVAGQRRLAGAAVCRAIGGGLAGAAAGGTAGALGRSPVGTRRGAGDAAAFYL